MTQKKKILIVGGAGYIGSYVNKWLNEKGYDTVVLDNLSRGSKQNVLSGEFILGDMGDPVCLETLFENESFDAVMHFAAFTDVGESVENPALYYQNNVVNTLNLLNTMVKYGVLHFIFSSSAAIFGHPQAELVAEDHPKEPINPYGKTKWMVEEILKDYSTAYGLQFSSLRYFNAAGADPKGEIHYTNLKPLNLIPIILQTLRDPSKKLEVFGNDYPTKDGTCIRDYIHIHDLATAHLLALEKLWEGGTSTFYNLGNGKGFSVLEVIEATKKATGEEVSFTFAPRRPGDPPYLLCDAAKAKKELGWKPIYPNLETIILHAWETMVLKN